MIVENTSMGIDAVSPRKEVLVSSAKICPRCGTAFSGEIAAARNSTVCKSSFNKPLNDFVTLYALHYCPACEKAFMGVYAGVECDPLELKEIFPQKVKQIDFPREIADFSPNFVKIYNEAYAAECQELTNICGMGYRKALEFLVKDFLIRQEPANEAEISKATLSQLINNKIENDKLKTLASRATWLGNDETHYYRLHEDRDLQDMKKFLHAFVTFLNAEIALNDALTIKSKKG